MSDIYMQFGKATSNITAYALFYAGKVVGRIVIKRSAACTAYVHFGHSTGPWTVQMVRAGHHGLKPVASRSLL